MTTFLIVFLWLVVGWQAWTIRRYRAACRQSIENTQRAQEVIAAQGLHVQAQEQRYHLMWDVRRLHEQQIYRLQLEINALRAFIRSRWALPPNDEGEEWKRG